MGSCLGCCVVDGNDNEYKNDDNTSEINKPFSSENEKEIIQVKIDNIEPWKYSEQLGINQVTEMLKDMTFDDCQPFVAPIKYGKVVKVYDGDTVHIIAPLFDGVTSRFKVRLAGIDTPEIRTKDEWEKKAGYIAKDILNEKIGDKIIELRNVSYDKYGRILADIILNNENINQWLINIEWACPYNGKGSKLVKNTNWKSKVMQYQNTKHET